MSEFNRDFDDVFAAALQGEETPQIEDFIKTPEWTRLSQAASLALLVFEHESSR